MYIALSRWHMWGLAGVFRAWVHVAVNFEYRLEPGLCLIWAELAQKCNELVIGPICLPQLLLLRVSPITAAQQKYNFFTQIQKYKNTKYKMKNENTKL